MIKLSEGGIADMWTQNTTPEIQALSYALQNAIAKVEAYVAKTKCYSDIDNLDEETLDYFAVEQRSMFYDQSMTIEQKRKIIKNTLNWYTKAGTPSAVAEMVAAIFGDGTVVEWFDFVDGEGDIEPYTFDVQTDAEVEDPEEYMEQIANIISKVKNVRSHLRRVLFQRVPEVPVAVGVYPWSFSVVTVRNDYEKTVFSDVNPVSGTETEALWREYTITASS